MRSHVRLGKAKGRGGLRRLKKYLDELKPTCSARAPAKKPNQPTPTRYLGFRTFNLPRGLTADAAIGVLEAATRLYPGLAADHLHIALSPHPEERIIDDKVWDQIWDIYRRELGLSSMLAFIVRHGDGHKKWREKHPDHGPIYHEHGVFGLVDPRNQRRPAFNDYLQHFEIADGYVEARWGLTKSSPRPNLRWKPSQDRRLKELRALGQKHRSCDQRGEPVSLPSPPDLAGERKRNERQRYRRRKQSAEAIKAILPLPLHGAKTRTWADLHSELASRGLQYRIGRFRVGSPSKPTGRLVLLSDPRVRVPASDLGTAWEFDTLVSRLGPLEATPRWSREDRLKVPTRATTSLPELQEGLLRAGLAYEIRTFRTKSGKIASSGWLRHASSGKLERATHDLALSRLIQRFGAGARQTLARSAALAPPEAMSNSGPSAPSIG